MSSPSAFSFDLPPRVPVSAPQSHSHSRPHSRSSSPSNQHVHVGFELDAPDPHHTHTHPHAHRERPQLLHSQSTQSVPFSASPVPSPRPVSTPASATAPMTRQFSNTSNYSAQSTGSGQAQTHARAQAQVQGQAQAQTQAQVPQRSPTPPATLTRRMSTNSATAQPSQQPAAREALFRHQSFGGSPTGRPLSLPVSALRGASPKSPPVFAARPGAPPLRAGSVQSMQEQAAAGSGINTSSSGGLSNIVDVINTKEYFMMSGLQAKSPAEIAEMKRDLDFCLKELSSASKRLESLEFHNAHMATEVNISPVVFNSCLCFFLCCANVVRFILFLFFITPCFFFRLFLLFC